MVYRGTEAGMPGYHHEWEAAKKLGVHARWQTGPTGFVSEDGRVTGVRCLKLDSDKKPIQGTDHVVPAELVLLAIGQAKLGSLAMGLTGIHENRGRIVTTEGGRTGHPRVFAGGDCANGGKEVVNAAAEGRDAAESIHAMLMGGE
jgi:dihydropyrimidine dehydrogenase (NAD+) subunit PreT